MKILICDDDKREGTSTRELIEKINSLYEVSYMNFNNVFMLLDQEEFGFDILITEITSLDMERNGIDLARYVNRKCSSCQVIYLTDNLDYAPMVYETTHCYFVVKDNKLDMLDKAIKKAVNNHNKAGHEDVISFLSGGHTVILLQREISYIERYDRFLKIHTDKKEYHCYRSLKQLYEQLAPSFVRCHGSFIVNLEKVSVTSNMEICLIDGTLIPIGKSFLEEFMERYQKRVR